MRRGIHLAARSTGAVIVWSAAMRARAALIGACLCMAFSSGALAQRVQIPSTAEPGAVERSIPLQQIPESSGQDLRVPAAPPTKAPSGAASILFTVNEIQIDGATALSPEQLAETYGDLVGTRISLSELYGVANAITAKYAAAGYALCFALVPAQAIKNGVVRIQVIEGFVARIVLENKHPAVPSVVGAYGWRLLHSRPLRTADLERYLLLANDIPGYTVKAVFDRLPDRNAAPGATELILHIDRRVADATITADNRGSRTLGSLRGDAFVSLRSFFGLGEEIQFHSLQSVQLGLLSYYSGLFSLPIDGEGTRATEFAFLFQHASDDRGSRCRKFPRHYDHRELEHRTSANSVAGRKLVGVSRIHRQKPRRQRAERSGLRRPHLCCKFLNDINDQRGHQHDLCAFRDQSGPAGIRCNNIDLPAQEPGERKRCLYQRGA